MTNFISRRSLLLGLGAAALAFSISLPGNGPAGFTTTALAEGGGGSDRFEHMSKRPSKKKSVKKKKRKSAAQKRAERKRKAAARKKAREAAKAAAKARRTAKYRAMTGKDLEKGMPSDKNFSVPKGSLAKAIDKAPTRKAKAKVARQFAKQFKTRAKQVQGRSVKKANAYRKFAGNLDNYADAQSK